MRINNHLDEPIIVNRYSRNNLVDLNDSDLYNLVGTEIKPKSSIELTANDDELFYFSNISGSKITHVAVNHLDSQIVNLWNHESDVIQCNNIPSCRREENIIMKMQLPNHIIWYIYNQATYLLVSLIIAILAVIIAIAIIIPIKK